MFHRITIKTIKKQAFETAEQVAEAARFFEQVAEALAEQPQAEQVAEAARALAALDRAVRSLAVRAAARAAEAAAQQQAEAVARAEAARLLP